LVLESPDEPDGRRLLLIGLSGLEEPNPIVDDMARLPGGGEAPQEGNSPVMV
jgi:hypothetical protein